MFETTILFLPFFLLLLFLPGAIFNNVHQLEDGKMEWRRIRRQQVISMNQINTSFPFRFYSIHFSSKFCLVKRELSPTNCGEWPNQLYTILIEHRIHWHSRLGHNGRVDLQSGIRPAGGNVHQLHKFSLESTSIR